MNPLITIVVPVYNVEKYLRRCLQSILNQSYKNLEIILVNDGSTDRCPTICDEYAEIDERIIVIHKKNGGLSDARNVGIECATGKFIGFIDSDDYIAPNMYEILINKITDYGADISVCDYRKVYLDKPFEYSICAEGTPVQDIEMNNVEALRDLFTTKKYGDVMAWNKLYKSKLFHHFNVRFPTGFIHEDNFTTYKLFYYANKIAYTNQALYYYVQRNDSIMGVRFNNKRLDMLRAAEEAIDFIGESSDSLKNEAIVNYLLTNLTLLNSMIEDRYLDNKILNQIRNNILDVSHDYNIIKMLSLKQKVGLMLLRVNVNLYLKAIYIRKKQISRRN